MCIRDRSTISGKTSGAGFDGDARNPLSDVSSIMDVPEYAIAKTTIANAPITPQTIILGFNIAIELILLLNVNIKNPYSAKLQNNYAIFPSCSRGKNSSQ